MKGTVKWFNGTKGYGFISTENDGDIFIHHSQINAEGYRTLNEGDEVEFDTKEGKKGLEATNCTVTRAANKEKARRS